VTREKPDKKPMGKPTEWTAFEMVAMSQITGALIDRVRRRVARHSPMLFDLLHAEERAAANESQA